MSDWAHDWTDDQIERLERRFAEEYAQAAREMREKLSKAYEEQQEAQKSWRERVRKGEATSEEYKDWLRERANDRKFIRGLAQTLADDASRANQLARDYINDELPKVYAENANYAAYGIETNIGYDTHSFDLYDQSTVRRLMGLTEHDQIIHEVIEVGPAIPGLQNLRTVNIDRARDVDWNRRKFTSAITQSILQGESIPNASKRLMRVLNMDRNMAVRAARTAITSAENAGRVDSYKRAERIGIKLEQQWMATLDERTRYSHRELDGQHVPVGKKFVAKSTGHEIEFPGDPKAHPSETYNCFVGDTLVCADTEIERSYKHEYSGELVTVKTASGIEFTCTPNHPILTHSGWVAAKLLHDGDHLCVARVGHDGVGGANPDVHHVQARMETVHDLLALRSRKRVAGLDVNFHGDVPASDVEIVGEEGPLRLDAEASGGEGVAELALEPTDPAGLRPRPSGKGFGRVMASAPRGLGREGVASTLLGCQFAHPHVHGIGTVAPFDPSIAEHPSDHVTGMTDTRGDCFLGLTTEIGVDHIINVKVTHTRGTHVYNLQTSDGYYFVGSEDTDNVIIAHNCRCTLVAWSPEMEAEDANTKRFTRLPKGMTYEEWKGAKQEEKANDRNPQTLAGVRRGRPMTFDEANELRGNPGYVIADKAGEKYLEANRRVNEYASEHGYDDSAELRKLREERDKAGREYREAAKKQAGYRINCQTCVVANEARRRGYDVEATPNTKGSANERLSYNTRLAWVDPSTGSHPEYARYDGAGQKDFLDRPMPTPKRCMEWLTRDGTIEDGARYTIEFAWKGRSGNGHIVCIERTDTGLRMYDPQCGRSYDEAGIADYLKDVRMKFTRYGSTYADGPRLLKVSDYDFDTDMCEQILRGRK